MIVRVSCPFCNTGFDLGVVSTDLRVTCPRCGESFPLKGDLGASIPSPSENDTALAPNVQSPTPSAKSLRSFAIVGLLAAVVVAGVGLYLIFRPGAGPKPVEPPRKQAATMPPAGIAGLAFLPSDTSAAFAIQPGPVIVYAERTKIDAKTLLQQAGVPARVFAFLDQSGVTLDRIDHIVGGIVLNENPIPRLLLVLTFLDPPVDDDALLKALKAQKFTAANGATQWKTDLGGLPAELTKVGDRTYVFATDGKDLDKAASSAGRGSGHLSLGIRQSFEKLSPASVVWLATDSTKWDDKPSVKLVAGFMKRPEIPAMLANVRAVAVGISLEPDPKSTAAVRAPDTAGAKKLADNAAANLAGKPVTIGEAGEWVTVESPFDPAQGLAGLQALFPKK